MPIPAFHNPGLFYLASGLANHGPAAVAIARLESMGWTCIYNWTLTGSVMGSGDAVKEGTAKREAEGVRLCTHLIVLLPGGRGTHTELGMGIAYRRNISIIHGGHPRNVVFYHHPDVLWVPTLDDFIAYHKEWFRGQRPPSP